RDVSSQRWRGHARVSIVVLIAVVAGCVALFIARAPSTPAPLTSSPSPRALAAVVENPHVGYRMTLPDGYHLSDCLSQWSTADGQFSGADIYTLRSIT